MFVDLDKEQINYFDSYGQQRPTPPEISELAAKLSQQGRKHGLNLKYSQNKSVFQKKNSECGVYCLYFLKKSLFLINLRSTDRLIIMQNFIWPKNVPVVLLIKHS